MQLNTLHRPHRPFSGPVSSACFPCLAEITLCYLAPSYTYIVFLQRITSNAFLDKCHWKFRGHLIIGNLLKFGIEKSTVYKGGEAEEMKEGGREGKEIATTRRNRPIKGILVNSKQGYETKGCIRFIFAKKDHPSCSLTQFIHLCPNWHTFWPIQSQ